MKVLNIKNCVLAFMVGCLIKVYISALQPISTHPFAHHEMDHHAKRYIVQLKDKTDKEKILKEGIGGRDVVILRELESINAILIKFTDDFEVDADFEDESVRCIEEDRITRWIDPIASDDLEVDSFRAKTRIPFGVKRVGINNQHLTKKVDATIAIIDSGVDIHNKSLNVVNVVNFVNGESSADLNGHGTHVAGTAAALNSGSGVVGIAPGAKLIALKVLDVNGSGKTSDIIAAINWVTQNADQVDVVNMSLGTMRGAGVDLIHEAIKKSVEKGIVYVVAAGNSACNIYECDNCPYNIIPAAYPEVMTVSAMVDSDGVAGGYGPLTDAGQDDRLASFSNYSDRAPPNNPVISPGATIDVAAPGVDILSTVPENQLMKMSGTSMASPHVTGVVARYIAKNRKKLFSNGKSAKTVYQIRQKLIDHAQPQHRWNAAGDANDPDNYHEGLIQIVEK